MLIRKPGPVKAHSLRKLNTWGGKNMCIIIWWMGNWCSWDVKLKHYKFLSVLSGFPWVCGCESCRVPGWHQRGWPPFPQSTWRKAPLCPPATQAGRWNCTGLAGLHSPEGGPLSKPQTEMKKCFHFSIKAVCHRVRVLIMLFYSLPY